MIKIEKYTDEMAKSSKIGWDFPIDELDYLLETHDGETFLLKDDRLYEKEEQ